MGTRHTSNNVQYFNDDFYGWSVGNLFRILDKYANIIYFIGKTVITVGTYSKYLFCDSDFFSKFFFSNLTVFKIIRKS